MTTFIIAYLIISLLVVYSLYSLYENKIISARTWQLKTMYAIVIVGIAFTPLMNVIVLFSAVVLECMKEENSQ